VQRAQGLAVGPLTLQERLVQARPGQGWSKEMLSCTGAVRVTAGSTLMLGTGP